MPSPKPPARRKALKKSAAAATPQPVVPHPVSVPCWEKIPSLLHGFSTRPAGHSKIYSPDRTVGELNLGFTASDTRRNVERNRRAFTQSLGAGKKTRLIPLRQIHSDLMREVTTANAVEFSGKKPLAGDGLITRDPDLLLAIQTADCIPIFIVDPVNHAVAAFHAGWRGTVRRIVQKGVGLMRLRYGSDPKKLLAAIGPGIGPCCYAVGEEVVSEFTSQFAYADKLFREVYDLDPIKEKYPMLFLTARAPGHSNLGPQTHLDLWEANRRQLLDAGLSPKNIWMSGECTSCDTQKYFSHRAERGFTGRMMSVIGLRR
jgi:polyphenol oxidase